jgi:outer membrane protein assembly factor BamD (BamD/ComL family)
VASFDVSEQPNSARVSLLDAETRALRRARDELRAGKLSDAFATLESARRQFSAPELYQEREALTIELLHRSGQATAAEQRANTFISRFPESPHVQQIRRFAGK